MKILYSKSLLFKVCIPVIFGIFLYHGVDAQPKNKWYGFSDKKTNLIGFKDAQGHIKIPAKFGGLTVACVFNNIVAVSEENSGKLYYLLKNGKKIGVDSLYTWDNAFDQEKENKIRLRVKKTDKVGFFNKDGRIVIPAIYNDARPFNNGLAIVVHDAKRECLDGGKYNQANPCEHWYWAGKTAIIDSTNKIVADNIDVGQTENIGWFTLKITKSKPDTILYTSFESPDHRFYSFLNYEKEFKMWFYKNYLESLDYQKLSSNCYEELTVEDQSENKNRFYYTKKSFLKRYQISLLKKMQLISMNKVKTNIFKESLNSYTYYKRKNFVKFFSEDGEPNQQKYPSFNVVSSYYGKNGELHQDQFLFIRTDSGYRLIEVALNI
jgi:hypothetical protein